MEDAELRDAETLQDTCTELPHYLRGTALYPLHSRMNHSCCPNAQVLRVAGDARIVVCAKEAIRRGDEVTISYLSADAIASMGVLERRAELVQQRVSGLGVYRQLARQQLE